MANFPMSAPRSATTLSAEPNVTPFIDVLLVLLVIFMLAQTIRQSTPLQTPLSGAAPAPAPVPAPPQIVLELRGDGSYAINQQPVPAAALVEQLRAIYASRSAKLLFVDAAPERSYQEVISTIGVARGAGVEVVAMMPGPEP